MSPIPNSTEPQRYSNSSRAYTPNTGGHWEQSNDSSTRGDKAWTQWGRWMLVGMVLGVTAIWGTVVVSSYRRTKKGKSPIPGTVWMMPPTYQASQQQHEEYLPAYNLASENTNESQQAPSYGTPNSRSRSRSSSNTSSSSSSEERLQSTPSTGPSEGDPQAPAAARYKQMLAHRAYEEKTGSATVTYLATR